MEDRRPFGERHPILLILLLPLLAIAAFIAKLFSKPVARTPASVAEILTRRLESDPDWHEWDDFVCVPIQEKSLDQIRLECRDMDPSGESPPVFISQADQARIREFISNLQRSNFSYKPTADAAA